MRVLYATDGGEAAAEACALIAAAADRDATQVTVASVVTGPPPSPRYARQLLHSPEERKAIAEQAVTTASDPLREAGFATDTQVVEGHPGREILQLAEQQGAELVVMGSGVTTLGDRLLGSVSTHVLHRAPMSVLIVHKRPSPQDVSVVVGVDGSEGAARAVDVASQFLDPQRCGVTVICVAELLTPTFKPPYVAHATSAPSREVEERVTKPAREHAEAAVGVFAGRGFDARPYVVLGHPVKRLLGEIDNLDADLAVVGSRGLDAVDRVALGSVSDQVARRAPATLVGR